MVEESRGAGKWSKAVSSARVNADLRGAIPGAEAVYWMVTAIWTLFESDPPVLVPEP